MPDHSEQRCQHSDTGSKHHQRLRGTQLALPDRQMAHQLTVPAGTAGPTDGTPVDSPSGASSRQQWPSIMGPVQALPTCSVQREHNGNIELFTAAPFTASFRLTPNYDFIYFLLLLIYMNTCRVPRLNESPKRFTPAADIRGHYAPHHHHHHRADFTVCL